MVKLGSPVTGVQLSPSQDLLATTHVKRRGIYLWYNHLMFGSGADIQPSTRPVNAALPSIATGESFCECLLCWNHFVTTCDVPPFTCSWAVIYTPWVQGFSKVSMLQHAVLFGISETTTRSIAAKTALSLVQHFPACNCRLEVQIRHHLHCRQRHTNVALCTAQLR